MKTKMSLKKFTGVFCAYVYGKRASSVTLERLLSYLVTDEKFRLYTAQTTL